MGSLSMVGRVLLLVGCTAAGNYLAARPMRRYRELMDAAQLVGELQSRLQYSLLPAAELLEQLSQEPRFCALPYLRRFAAGCSSSWSRAHSAFCRRAPTKKGCTPLWVRCWGWRCAF